MDRHQRVRTRHVEQVSFGFKYFVQFGLISDHAFAQNGIDIGGVNKWGVCNSCVIVQAK